MIAKYNQDSLVPCAGNCKTPAVWSRIIRGVMSVDLKLFDLTGRIAVITGGAGLLGPKHAEAIASMGGIPVLVDLPGTGPKEKARYISEKYSVDAMGFIADVSKSDQVQSLLEAILSRYQRVDILINNAANNPKVEPGSCLSWARLETFPLYIWEEDIAAGLTGAFLCSKIIGSELARRGHGVIINVCSDLAIIAPDQRLYRVAGLPDEQQPVKPVTYSVVKTALVGLTRYLATYWADKGVRTNAISFAGVYAGQPEEFVSRFVDLLPLHRMANVDEYQGAIIFLCSDASSFMTGSNLVMDGGRSCW